jgi:cytochrome c553
MLKLFAGLFAAAALAVLGHVALVQTSKSESGAAYAARSTCASCHR